jgi:hypothetical protein
VKKEQGALRTYEKNAPCQRRPTAMEEDGEDGLDRNRKVTSGSGRVWGNTSWLVLSAATTAPELIDSKPRPGLGGLVTAVWHHGSYYVVTCEHGAEIAINHKVAAFKLARFGHFCHRCADARYAQQPRKRRQTEFLSSLFENSSLCAGEELPE